MLRILSVVLVLLLSVWLVRVQAESMTSLVSAIQLSPSPSVKQGQIITIRIKAPKNTQLQYDNITAQLDIKEDGHPVSSPLFKQSDGSYQAILGIPVDTVPGQHIILLKTSQKPVQSIPITVLDSHFTHQNITVSAHTNGLKPLPGELEAIQDLKNTMTPIRYWQLPFISPTSGCENSPFGVKRYHNGVYIHDYHKGVDLKIGQGKPTYAIAGGIVKIAAPYFRLHGGTVGIDHGQGLASIYIHMSKVLVQPGQQVHQGDVIGLVGATGFATGPHLHWGLYSDGVPVNPDYWIPVPHCN